MDSAAAAPGRVQVDEWKGRIQHLVRQSYFASLSCTTVPPSPPTQPATALAVSLRTAYHGAGGDMRHFQCLLTRLGIRPRLCAYINTQSLAEHPHPIGLAIRHTTPRLLEQAMRCTQLKGTDATLNAVLRDTAQRLFSLKSQTMDLRRVWAKNLPADALFFQAFLCHVADILEAWERGVETVFMDMADTIVEDILQTIKNDMRTASLHRRLVVHRRTATALARRRRRLPADDGCCLCRLDLESNDVVVLPCQHALCVHCHDVLTKRTAFCPQCHKSIVG